MCMDIRILVFDDEKQIREMFGTFFISKGYKVQAFPDPSEWFSDKISPETCPRTGCERCADIIITDLNMLHMDGFQFIRELKRRKCSIPYIAVMTAYLAEYDAIIPLLRKHRIKLLLKPFSLNDVAHWVDDVAARITDERTLVPAGGANCAGALIE